MVSEISPVPEKRWWRYAWIGVAVLLAIPVGKVAYDRLGDATHAMRVRLIAEHRLWEAHPRYRGRPEVWTNMASRLLTDRQLLRRVRSKYGVAAESIELDYRRDLSIAQGEVIVVALAVWGAPVAALYAAGAMIGRRRRKISPPPPASAPTRPVYDESRYRPKP
jgi:hypothetical protein